MHLSLLIATVALEGIHLGITNDLYYVGVYVCVRVVGE